MTLSLTPFALQNSAHSAALFRQATSSLIPAGGGIIAAGDLAVTQTGTPSMNVSVGVGRCWIPGTNVGNVAGGNFSSQAMYYGENESAYTATVTTADSINPRVDVVYASVQDSQYAGSTNAGVIGIAAGVATSGANYPANAPTLPANSIALAWIYVTANASSIVNGNITQLQVNGLGYTQQTLALNTANFTNPPAGYGAPTLATSAGGSARVATLTGNVAWVNGSGGNNVATIPAGLRPPYQISFSSLSQNNASGGEGTKYRGTIETSGAVTLNWMSGGFARDSNNVIPIQATWLLP